MVLGVSSMVTLGCKRGNIGRASVRNERLGDEEGLGPFVLCSTTCRLW